MRLVLLALALVAEAVCIGLAGRFGDFTQAGHALRFVPLMLGAGVCFGCAIAVFPPGVARSLPWVVWAPCILFRLIALPMAPGDDLWRYLWEGRVQLAGHNPYLLSPAAPELTPLRDADWARINHAESPAIYPPLAELVFAALACVSATPLFFKCVFTLADLLVVGVLFKLVRGPERHRDVASYAWNPAVVYAFAGGGHFDSLMLLALMAAVWALARGAGAPPPRRDELGAGAPLLLASTVGLGVAVAFKIVPIFLLPVWAFALGRRWWLSGMAVVIPALLTLPFGGPAVVLRPLLAFAEVTRFNDLVWGFLEQATIANPLGRNWPFTLALSVTVAVIAWKMRDDWPRAVLWVLGALLLLSPVLHPWYATWILPVAVWRRQPAWTVLSITALGGFLLWETTPWWTAWQPNLLTRAMVAAPPLFAWVIAKRMIAKVPTSAR